MKFLSEITLVPIGSALIVFGSGAIWMTRISMEQDAHANRLVKAEQRLDAEFQLFQEIKERLIKIEVSIEKKK